MSKTENPTTAVVKRETYLDFDGVIKTLRKRGHEIDLKTISRQIGYSTVGLQKLRKKSPNVVSMIHQFLKDNDLKFEDLVKEIE